MWDNGSLLQLIKSMPAKLTREHLEKLQAAINTDKYKNSVLSGFDLCGMYATFCRDCKKTSIYPCAVAYVNFMKASGMDVEIDAKPMDSLHVEQSKQTVENIQQPKVQDYQNNQATPVNEKPIESIGSRKIRIAYARRKGKQ